MTSKQGILEITIVSASKLKNTAYVGKMDPYCVVFFLGEKTRTKTIKNGGSDPVWEESYKCKTSSDITDQTIKLMIKNENRMLSDEIIGVSEMSLGDCFRLGKDTIDAPVLSAKTRERVGDVRVRCEFRANESDATRVEKSMEKMVAEKVKEVVENSSSGGNVTISGSMDKLVLEEEKKPQYRVNKISEAVVGANEGWY
jgi:Ca2+-dependent lipid-binding protein